MGRKLYPTVGKQHEQMPEVNASRRGEEYVKSHGFSLFTMVLASVVVPCFYYCFTMFLQCFCFFKLTLRFYPKMQVGPKRKNPFERPQNLQKELCQRFVLSSSTSDPLWFLTHFAIRQEAKRSTFTRKAATDMSGCWTT